MLWTIFIVLIILWAIGFIGFSSVGWYIHLLLVLAVGLVLIRLIQGRNPIK